MGRESWDGMENVVLSEGGEGGEGREGRERKKREAGKGKESREDEKGRMSYFSHSRSGLWRLNRCCRIEEGRGGVVGRRRSGRSYCPCGTTTDFRICAFVLRLRGLGEKEITYWWTITGRLGKCG